MNESITKVRAIDFDRLDVLVSERVGALKFLAGRLPTSGDTTSQDAICRDFVLPAVLLLLKFVDSVDVDVVSEQ